LLLKKLDLDQIAFFDHNLMEWYGRALHTSVMGATAKTAPARGRSAADCSEYRQAAGAIAPNVTRISLMSAFGAIADITRTCSDVRF